MKDYHVSVAKSPQDALPDCIVVEPTPRVLAVQPGWELATFRKLIENEERVRISGWLMFDPLHPEHLGKYRGTLWEIHPVVQVEVKRGHRWVPLDDLQTDDARRDPERDSWNEEDAEDE